MTGKTGKSIDDLLFKSPLVPARSYHSPRRSQFSPRPGLPPSLGRPCDAPSPKYCPVLCDPLSPMPATPQYIHVDDEDDGEEEGGASMLELSVSRAPPADTKPLPGGERRRGQLDRVLQNLKKTAENQAASSQGTSKTAVGPSALSTKTSRRRKRAEEPAKAVLNEAPEVAAEELEAVRPCVGDSMVSIFDSEMDPLNLQGDKSRESRQVDDSAVEESADGEMDLVERVRKALELQKQLEEDRPASRYKTVRSDSVTPSQTQQLASETNGLKSCNPGKLHNLNLKNAFSAVQNIRNKIKYVIEN